VDLLAAFADADVRYLIIGGYAVGFHDRPRATKDLDLLLADDPDNVERACRALAAFGAAPATIDALRHSQKDEVVWFGVPPSVSTCSVGAWYRIQLGFRPPCRHGSE
jgi:hypothetical protein